MMTEVTLERLRAHQKNVDRYRKLLATRLSDLERAYIERRLAEEQASMKALLQQAFPDRLSARMPKTRERGAKLDMAALHPADAFGHPMDVVDDCDLTNYEKRAILSSWAADACVAPEQRRPAQHTAVSFDDILDALHLVDSEKEPVADYRAFGRQSGARRSDHSFF